MAIEKAKASRELFLVEGAKHVDMYDKEQYVDPAVEKLSNFYKQYLQSKT
jgi:fermentation-respiration switch protein FrsA (DUF1100 family)